MQLSNAVSQLDVPCHFAINSMIVLTFRTLDPPLIPVYSGRGSRPWFTPSSLALSRAMFCRETGNRGQNISYNIGPVDVWLHQPVPTLRTLRIGRSTSPPMTYTFWGSNSCNTFEESGVR